MFMGRKPLIKKLILKPEAGHEIFSDLVYKLRGKRKLINGGQLVDTDQRHKFFLVVNFNSKIDFVCFLLTPSFHVIERTEVANEEVFSQEV